MKFFEKLGQFDKMVAKLSTTAQAADLSGLGTPSNGPAVNITTTDVAGKLAGYKNVFLGRGQNPQSRLIAAENLASDIDSMFQQPASKSKENITTLKNNLDALNLTDREKSLLGSKCKSLSTLLPGYVPAAAKAQPKAAPGVAPKARPAAPAAPSSEVAKDNSVDLSGLSWGNPKEGPSSVKKSYDLALRLEKKIAQVFESPVKGPELNESDIASLVEQLKNTTSSFSAPGAYTFDDKTKNMLDNMSSQTLSSLLKAFSEGKVRGAELNNLKTTLNDLLSAAGMTKEMKNYLYSKNPLLNKLVPSSMAASVKKQIAPSNETAADMVGAAGKGGAAGAAAAAGIDYNKAFNDVKLAKSVAGSISKELAARTSALAEGKITQEVFDAGLQKRIGQLNLNRLVPMAKLLLKLQSSKQNEKTKALSDSIIELFKFVEDPSTFDQSALAEIQKDNDVARAMSLTATASKKITMISLAEKFETKYA